MSVLRRHPLVRADISEAINWYEDQQPGLGLEFTTDLLFHYRHLVRDAQLYAIRFADVRRLNLDRFPYGLFYVIHALEVSTPAATLRKSLLNADGFFVAKKGDLKARECSAGE